MEDNIKMDLRKLYVGISMDSHAGMVKWRAVVNTAVNFWLS
jgi:hypothetical protein